MTKSGCDIGGRARVMTTVAGVACGCLVALLPGTNSEGKGVEMKDPGNGNRAINAGEAASRAPGRRIF